MVRLTPEQLYRACDPGRLPADGSDGLEDLVGLVGQDRASEALGFGIAIRHPRYNLFALGPAGIDKHAFLKDYLSKSAADCNRLSTTVKFCSQRR